LICCRVPAIADPITAAPPTPNEAAILQVQDQWKFEPAVLNGRHLPVEANIEVTFRLY